MMRRLPRWWPRDRRQAQSGATLVELLVAVVIMGLALTLIIGTFSTGLLESSMDKRNTAGLAVTQYELDRISGSAWGTLPAQFSDCFATEDTTKPPTPPLTFQGNCPSTSYTLRADVTMAPVSNYEVWSITVTSWPNGTRVGSRVDTIKVNR